MANLNVTYDDLHETAQRLLAGRDDLNSKLTELSSIVQNLTSNGFQAEQSSAAYRDSYEQFTSGTRQAVEGLEGLSKFLVSAADTLRQTDEGLASSIKGS
jgi:WXG100 family type VII secretion target